MKFEDLKIGLWIRNPNGNHLRITDVWEGRNVFKLRCQNDCVERTETFDGYYAGSTISTPAELDSAGIADADRLVEQQAWREGVELWDVSDGDNTNHAWFKVDGEWVGATSFATIPDKGIEMHSDRINVTSDPSYASIWTREHFRDFVIDFRKKRDGTGLKWDDAAQTVTRTESLLMFAWLNGKWEHVGSIEDFKLSGLPAATPAQIAQSGCPIEDVPMELRDDVKRLRTLQTIREISEKGRQADESGEWSKRRSDITRAAADYLNNTPPSRIDAEASRPWLFHEGPDHGVGITKTTRKYVRFRRSIRGGNTFRIWTEDDGAHNAINWSAQELFNLAESLDGSPLGIVESIASPAEVKP